MDLDKEVEKPYIKKPPNAFMIFMKEQRSKILPEILKQGSGAVNAVLGKMVTLSKHFLTFKSSDVALFAKIY